MAHTLAAAGLRPAIPLPRTGLWIGGSWRDASDGGTFVDVDPATEEPITEIAAATSADVDAAVAAAREQFDGGPWSRLSGAQRGVLLARMADLVEREAESFARMEALDVGKPLRSARADDVALTIDTFRHFAGWADKIEGRLVDVGPYEGRPRHAYVRREPVGVVAAITPWNGPAVIATWKVAPALAAGCTVVIKPPEDASLTTLRLAELFDEAGFPHGAVNVVPGLGEVAGAALVRHPGVDKVSFTGSTEVGREIGRVAGEQLKKVTLELGGKSPQIVFPDADLERAIPIGAFSFWCDQGEVCAAGTRIFVHRSVHDQVVEGLAEAARAVRVGDPFDEDVEMGALINAVQLDRVMGYIDTGRREGAELVAGGRRLDRPGYFVEPTLFLGNNDLVIAREEIFGPVGTVIPFDEPEEAVRLANDTPYGLLAVIWTSDIATAHTTAARLRAGAVWINQWGPPDARMPWGGTKASGLGRELGWAGIEACTEEKAVTVVL